MAAREIPIVGYESKLLSRVEVAEGTMAFHFEKPSGFKFKAGQFADMTLIEPPETDAEGNTRTLSIASPPPGCGTLLSSVRGRRCRWPRK
jgi:ferredoxin-NADP reductase